MSRKTSHPDCYPAVVRIPHPSTIQSDRDLLDAVEKGCGTDVRQLLECRLRTAGNGRLAELLGTITDAASEIEVAVSSVSYAAAFIEDEFL